MINLLDQLDIKIKKKKLELTRLYAKKKQLSKQEKIRLPEGERKKQIGRLAKKGATLAQIASSQKISEATAKEYLRRYVHDEALESLLAKQKATVIRPNQWGGADWNYMDEDYELEIHAINEKLAHKLPDRYVCPYASCSRKG